MLHTFVALVSDKPGVASLFRRLNINIVSRTTIVCASPETTIHRWA